jgi:hypothetical protein
MSRGEQLSQLKTKRARSSQYSFVMKRSTFLKVAFMMGLFLQLPLTQGHVATMTLVGRRSAAEEKSLREECNPVEKCEMCTYSDQKSYPACKQSGRKQKFECVIFDDDGKASFSNND